VSAELGEDGPPTALTSGRLLARNAAINLLGQGAPMVVAIVAIPLLISGLGVERFGVLTLMWVVIGYFSLLDLGLSRALTQLVADRLGRGRHDEVPALVWTALALVLGLGLAGTVVAALIAPWLIQELVTLPEWLRAETLPATYLLALSLPAVASTAALRGVLEASQRFDLVNALRIPLAVFSYASPLFVLPFSSSLVPIIAVLLAGRLVAWAAHLWLCLRAVPGLRRVAFHAESLTPLIRFGSWTTVSNVVSPLLVYLDRFLIGGMLSVAAVAFYVTPYEVVTKLLIVPAALMGVFFPAFATTFARDPVRTARLYGQSVRALGVMMFPVVLVIVTLASEGLQLWLGDEFSLRSAAVLRWLAVGVFINALAQSPFAVIQGAGRPDVTGRLHLAELPLYVALLWVMVGRLGIEGAAMAWTARIVVDTLALFYLADRQLGGTGALMRPAAGLLATALALLGVGAALEGTGVRLAFLAVMLPLTLAAGWRRVLQPVERTAILRTLHLAGPEAAG
jgi:O-antigen/teichoic acid export membrane protein